MEELAALPPSNLLVLFPLDKFPDLKFYEATVQRAPKGSVPDCLLIPPTPLPRATLPAESASSTMFKL
jgi:hypothetical protein